MSLQIAEVFPSKIRFLQVKFWLSKTLKRNKQIVCSKVVFKLRRFKLARFDSKTSKTSKYGKRQL